MNGRIVTALGAEQANEPVFVLGLMRSGTTFVQRVLNTHPDLTVWGEHGAALRPLLTPIESVVFDEQLRSQIAHGYSRRQGVIGPLQDPDAFDAYVSPVPPAVYESFVDDAIRNHMIALFTEGLASGTRWGFKETRYAGSVYRRLAELFPAASFVFVGRDAASWLSSVVRAPFRNDLDPAHLSDDVRTSDVLDGLLDLWVNRTRATLEFAQSGAGRPVLVFHPDFAESQVARLFDQLRLSGTPRRVGDVFSSRAGSSDRAGEWDGVRGELDERIREATSRRADIGALEGRMRRMHSDWV